MTRHRIPLLVALALTLGGSGCVGLRGGRGEAHVRYQRGSHGGDALSGSAAGERCDCGHPQCDGHHTTVVIVHAERG